MNIIFFHRRPLNIGQYSIEFLFDAIRQHLPATIHTRKYQTQYYSKGLINRLKMIWECAGKQGEINHITGDIHFIAFGLCKKKTILTIHDLGFLSTSNKITKYILKWLWLNLPAWRVAAITVVSEATKQHLLSEVNIKANKIRVIGNFISSDYTPIYKEFNPACPVVLQIGCAPNKNIVRLAQALQGIRCKLVVVGNLLPNDRAALEKYAIEYEHKSMLSHDEIRQEYARCDMVSFVSLLEGFGLPILEAQTTGRVILTSNISSMPEVAGKGALLVNPYNIEEIRQGILAIIENAPLRDQLIKNGFENVKRFDPKVIAMQYFELYTEILNTNKKCAE